MALHEPEPARLGAGPELAQRRVVGIHDHLADRESPAKTQDAP
jgi:hypothetical protein